MHIKRIQEEKIEGEITKDKVLKMLEEEREEDFSKRTRAINNLMCIQRDNEISSKLKLKEQEKEVELLEKIKIIDMQT